MIGTRVWLTNAAALAAATSCDGSHGRRRNGCDAQDARVADAVAGGHIRWIRLQREDAHLADVAVRVADPNIAVRQDCWRGARKLQSCTRLANGQRLQELGWRPSIC